MKERERRETTKEEREEMQMETKRGRHACSPVSDAQSAHMLPVLLNLAQVARRRPQQPRLPHAEVKRFVGAPRDQWNSKVV